MNQQELEKNAADLQAKLDEMKAAITKMKAEPSGFWKPEIGEAYYSIGCDGVISSIISNAGDYMDAALIRAGNAYRTHQEAERARDKQEVTQRLRELAGGYMFKDGADNWYLFYNTDVKEWITGFCLFSFYPNATYFPTEKVALAARDELGQRLDVLLEIEE